MMAAGEGALVEVFERYTDRARRAVVLAQEEARMLNHNYIGTEHILLGLIREGEGVAAQVLVKLGADLNRIRQQVIQLLHGYQGKEPAGEGKEPAPGGPRLGKRERARLMDDALGRIAALDRRLAAIERWVGMRPDLDDVDQEIARARREKEAAIDSQDFETAAALLAKEKELLAARASREKDKAVTGERPSLAAEVVRVNAELERLRAILRQHGLETDNGAP
jgi:ATP-dependent Clp protease ATP-binding subunit ClpA